MKRWIISLLIAALVSLLHLELFTSSWGEQIEYFAHDLWYNLSGSRQPPEQLALVVMDEISYSNLGLSLNEPWPRSLHARLLERLSEAGVKRVVFDVLFLGSGSDPLADQDLSKSLSLKPAVLGAESAFRDHAGAGGTYQLEELLLAHKPFAAKAECSALVGLPEDHGHIRRFLTRGSSWDPNMLSLAEAGAGYCMKAGKKPAPHDLIRYYGPPGTLQNFSYYQVIDPEHPVPDALLAGKTIFVGLLLRTEVGPAQKDVFLTPYFRAPRMFGTEIHATAAANLLDENWVQRSSPWQEALWLSICCLILSFALVTLRPLVGSAIVVGVALIWSVLSYQLFTGGFFLPGAALACVVLPFVLLASTLYFYFSTRRAQLQMLSAFERYLSPEMAKRITEEGVEAQLGGEKVWATALFSDIQDFTALTEEMPAERVAAMLNAYFTEVVEAIFDHKGTLVKFIGDAAFAIWGAPVRIDNHAELACRAALDMRARLERFNSSERFPELKTRVGIHTGPMVVGNLGSERRFDYTAIGDAVNLAARVEGLNKYLGTELLITNTTRKELGGLFATLEVGSMVVSGKQESESLYLLQNETFNETLVAKWNEALTHFRSRRWSEAQACFRETMSASSALEHLSGFYLAELEDLAQSELAPDWGGDLSFDRK